MKLKLITLPSVIACLLPFQALAQTPVPLEPSLLQWTWSVVEFPGKSPDSAVPTIRIDDEHETLTGKTACNTDWWADVELDFPKLKISNVQATAYECADAREVSKFLNILEEADRFRTAPDGLEMVRRDGSRLLLMVTGG